MFCSMKLELLCFYLFDFVRILPGCLLELCVSFFMKDTEAMVWRVNIEVTSYELLGYSIDALITYLCDLCDLK